MKTHGNDRRAGKPARIKTTLLELLDELSSTTADDALVMARVKNIFRSYKIRFAHTLAPVVLVRENSNRAARRSSAWA